MNVKIMSHSEHLEVHILFAIRKKCLSSARNLLVDTKVKN